MSNLKRYLLVMTSIATMGVVMPVSAQSPEGVDEIIVTATKRAENIQDIPLAVTAFSAQSLARDRIDDLQEIAVRTPSFLIGQNGPTAPELTIRGVGSTDREAGSERSVVVFVDEIYIGRAGASTFDLYDLERVEVLRGPQGSIFGRNAVGGSVNLVTANPEFEPETHMNFTLGNLDLFEAQGAVTGAISETLAGRLAVSYKQRDGYIDNRIFGFATADNTEALSGRAKLLYKPSENFKTLLTVEGTTDTVDGISSTITQGATTDDRFFGRFNTLFGGAATFPSEDLYVSDNNEFGSLDRNIFAITGRADWVTSLGDVTALVGYREAEFDLVRELAGIPIVPVGSTQFVAVGTETLGFSNGFGFESAAANDETYEAFSAELRVASPADSESAFSWLAGVYYLNESTDRVQIRERNLGRSNGVSALSRPQFDQGADLSSYAIFANATVSLFDDRVNLTAGGRYTSDKKDFALTVSDTITDANRAAILAIIPGATFSLNPAQAIFSTSADETFNSFTPEGTLDFKLTENVLLYGKVSTGFKSGGFVGLGANAQQATLPFAEETVLNFEAGFKSNLFENKLTINANIFQMDFDNLQLRDRQLLTPGDESSAIVTIVNAANAEVKGLEADIAFNPVPALDIVGGLSFIDTEITEIAEGSTIELGSELPRAPGFSTSWNANYTFYNVGSGELTIGAGLQHVGSHFFDINEDTAGTEPSYTLFDARLSYRPDNRPWSVSVWGKNLGDKYYRTQVQSALGEDVGVVSRIGEPLTWGVTFNLNL